MKSIPSVPWYILPVIVFAQFAGTSLWFAGNAILADLSLAFDLGNKAVSDLTSAVQFGFIAGTLVFATLSIADRYSPTKVFLTSSILAALFNILIFVLPVGTLSLWIYRFLTGFFLAGIYPVGMKIAADWYAEKLGKALGFLLGALVLGTAFPHLVRSLGSSYSWQMVLTSISVLAVIGGFTLFFLVPDGPHRSRDSRLRLTAFIEIFRVRNFRSAAFGYFGHMWELYSFWAFIPLVIAEYNRINSQVLPESYWSFIIIAVGALGCSGGGLLANRLGSARVAFWQLAISGCCCVLSLFLLEWNLVSFIGIMLLWGICVIGDSPQFSTLVAQTAPVEYIGTALTITNCIGFTITIVSLQVVGFLALQFDLQNVLIVLVLGPILGLAFLRRLI